MKHCMEFVRTKYFAVISLVVIFNVITLVAAGIMFSSNRSAFGISILAYLYGLKHAMDADHIAAIDNVTRQLVSKGQKPVSVGLYFSLGHSTVVFIVILIVIASLNSIDFTKYENISGIVGASVSFSFLMIVGIVNSISVYYILKSIKSTKNDNSSIIEIIDTDKKEKDEEQQHHHTVINENDNFDVKTERKKENEEEIVEVDGDEQTKGKCCQCNCIANLLFRLLTSIDKPWKMYFVGFLFGLGFDTASEIALLGLSITGSSGGQVPMQQIIILPLLFASGMCLVDTVDSLLMLHVYGFASLTDMDRLKYSLVVTVLSVTVAFFISIFQLLSLIQATTSPAGGFWEAFDQTSDNFMVIGCVIAAAFVISFVVSYFLIKTNKATVVQVDDINNNNNSDNHVNSNESIEAQ